MRTFLFTLFILAVVGGGLWYRFYGFGDGDRDGESSSSIAPISEWKAIMEGTWDFKKEYRSKMEGWIEEGEIEFLPSGIFKQYSTFKGYYNQSPTVYNILDESYLWYQGGGSVLGQWQIDTVKGAWVSKITDCNVFQSWIKDDYKQDHAICPTYFIQILPTGNYQNEVVKTWVEKFSQDSIVVKGKYFSNNEIRTFRFGKRK